MKTLKRILLGLLVIIVLVIVIGFFLLSNLKNAAIPDYNKNVSVQGIKEEVTILRDTFGIPHVYAQNEWDLYKAVGFTMAQDRLWQMDLLRRVTQGRLSEILGKDQLNTDLLMRALRIQEKSETILASADPKIVASLQSFADGVNNYIENYPLPPEFKVLGYKPEPWQPVHSINLIGYMAWDLSSGWGIEILLHNLQKELGLEQINDLIPNMKNQKTAVYPNFKLSEIHAENILLSANNNLEKLGVEIFSGSNNWAISGKKSNTGKPLLANDMHLGLFAPESGTKCIRFRKEALMLPGWFYPDNLL